MTKAWKELNTFICGVSCLPLCLSVHSGCIWPYKTISTHTNTISMKHEPVHEILALIKKAGREGSDKAAHPHCSKRALVNLENTVKPV